MVSSSVFGRRSSRGGYDIESGRPSCIRVLNVSNTPGRRHPTSST